MAFRIVLADDHPSVRQIVKAILAEDKEMEVIGEVEDGFALLRFLGDLPTPPDLAIVDISMPKLQGIEVARRIKLLYPSIKILLLTVHQEKEYLSQAFRAGVEGYLLKEEANTSLFTAIQSIRSGKTYQSPLVNDNDTPH
ncbi:MAG TPA: response regulator transcription factor [Acidobacteriota bacterium]|nr:response regulator transcription factor [Acidobacteriota bacterium]